MHCVKALQFIRDFHPSISSIVRSGASRTRRRLLSSPLLSAGSCGLFWRSLWQRPVLMAAGGVSCPTTGDHRQKRAEPSWQRSLSSPKCWRCTRSRTAFITTCLGSTTPTCSSLQRSSCCATRRGAACWRSPPDPGSMSPAWVTSPASPTVSPKTTATTSFSGEKSL